MDSKVYKVLTGIIAIGGFICGIIFGFTTRTIGLDYEENFNSSVMLLTWASTILPSFLFYGIALILQKLDEIIDMGNIKISKKSNHKSVDNEIKEDDQNFWECPNCHSKNKYNGNPECPKCKWKL